jgi:hypothetical protein
MMHKMPGQDMDRSIDSFHEYAHLESYDFRMLAGCHFGCMPCLKHAATHYETRGALPFCTVSVCCPNYHCHYLGFFVSQVPEKVTSVLSILGDGAKCLKEDKMPYFKNSLHDDAKKTQSKVIADVTNNLILF